MMVRLFGCLGGWMFVCIRSSLWAAVWVGGCLCVSDHRFGQLFGWVDVCVYQILALGSCYDVHIN